MDICTDNHEGGGNIVHESLTTGPCPLCHEVERRTNAEDRIDELVEEVQLLEKKLLEAEKGKAEVEQKLEESNQR